MISVFFLLCTVPEVLNLEHSIFAHRPTWSRVTSVEGIAPLFANEIFFLCLRWPMGIRFPRAGDSLMPCVVVFCEKVTQ